MDLTPLWLELEPGRKVSHFPRLAFVISQNMTKSVRDSKKVRRKVGRKTTGSGEVQIVRMHKPQIAAIDAWMTSQYGDITRPEAIRRLVGLGLKAKK